MKIAFFSENFYPELSGISDFLITLSQGLSQRGHVIRIYAPAYAQKDYEKVHADEEKDFGSNISVKRLFSLPISTGTGQGRMVIPFGTAMRDFRSFQPNVVHTQLFFGVGIEALWAAKKSHIPFVGTNHTVMSEFIPKLLKKNFTSMSLKYVSWYYNHCQVVTAPSRLLLKEMKEFGLSKPMQYVPNPIDTIQFHAPDEPTKLKLKKRFDFSSATMVYAGRLSREKNIDHVIQAFHFIKKTVPNALFVLAGHGPEEEHLKSLAKQLGVEQSVRFLGTVDKPTLAQVYSASEVFVSASASENQPLTLLQAFACGLPAVGVNARGLGEHIDPSCGIRVEPGTIQGLSDATLRFFTQPQYAKECGKNAHKWADQYSISRVTEQWEALYESCIQKSTPHL